MKLKETVFLLFLLQLQELSGEFELMDCEWGTVFEYPAIKRKKALEVMYLRSFQMINFSRIVWYSGKEYRGGCNFFGDKDYMEWEVLINYSYKSKVATSVKIMGIQVEDRNDFTGGVDLGFGYSLTPQLKLNFGIHNFYSLPTEISLPSRMIVKFYFEGEAENCSWLEIFKEGIYPYELRIGNKIKIHKLLYLWVRLKTYPQQVSIGVIFPYSKWKFSYIGRTHRYLGFSYLVRMEFFL